MIRHLIRTTGALLFLLGAASSAAQNVRSAPSAGLPSPTKLATRIKVVDPCVVATASQLKPSIAAMLDTVSMHTFVHGVHYYVNNLDLRIATCAHPLRIEMRGDFRAKKTTGFPQGSISGKIRLEAPLLARIQYTYGSDPNGPVTSANLVDAWACLTDISSLTLDLENVPSWIDQTVLRGLVNNALIGIQRCANIKGFVALYLQIPGTTL